MIPPAVLLGKAPETVTHPEIGREKKHHFPSPAIARPRLRPVKAAPAPHAPSAVPLFTEGRFQPNLALSLSTAHLDHAIGILARKYATAHKLPWHNSMQQAPHWSCRLLGASRSSLHAFFADVRRSALARSGPEGLALALAAGCHAWQTLRADPHFLPPGSIKARLRDMNPASQAAYINESARFHHVSCLIEGVEISVANIAGQLKSGLDAS